MTGATTVTAPAAFWGLRALVGVALVAAFGATLVTVIGGGASLGLPTVYAVTTTSFLVVGWLISERRPGNVVGPLILVLGLLVCAYIVLDAWVRSPGPRPGIQAAALAVSVIDGPLFLTIAVLFLYFPDGRLPGSWWRILAGVAATLATVTFVGALARPGPFPYYTWLENPLAPPPNPIALLWEPAYGAVVGCVAVAALSLFVRWRRAGAVERAQLKWAASAAVLVATAMVTYGAGAGPSQYSDVGDLAVGVSLGLFPIAIGIAVLRYRLYEIDRLISRTIGWAIVTGVLIAVFAGGVVVLQAILTPVTSENTLAVAASTLVAFALFQPLRRRVQRAVDRRFDRARYNARGTADAFARRLRVETDMSSVLADLSGTTGAAVAPISLGVWIRPPRGPR